MKTRYKTLEALFNDDIRVFYSMKYLVILLILIGFSGIAYAVHDPNQPQPHSIVMPPDTKEKTFEEFMEWCKPYYGERCTELYEKNQVSKVLSPLKQTQSGIPFNEIQCKDNLVLIHKYDSSPACVYNETKKVLVERGWAKPDIRASTE